MSKGGRGGLWQLAKDPGTRGALRLMALVSWKFANAEVGLKYCRAIEGQ
jgi:hypothetical protein